jgi:hypothetical protein
MRLRSVRGTPVISEAKKNDRAHHLARSPITLRVTSTIKVR